MHLIPLFNFMSSDLDGSQINWKAADVNALSFRKGCYQPFNCRRPKTENPIIICAVISVCLPVILCGQRYALQQGPRTIYANTKVRATVNFFGPSWRYLLLCWSDLRLLFFPTEEICFVGMDQASFLIYCSTVIMLKRWPYWYLTLEGYIAESYLADWSNQSPIRYLVKLYRAKFCHAIKVSCHQNCPWSK